jgi:hypothetical protein
MREWLIVERLLTSGVVRCLKANQNMTIFAEIDRIHQVGQLQEPHLDSKYSDK